MKEVTPLELKKMMDAHEDFQLIDVREEYEADICAIGGKLIPMGEIMQHMDEIAKDKKVVVHCRSGKRSATVIQMLEPQGFNNLYNLKGGILAYADDVDPKLAKY
ncbi:MAG TPA: rhodanese-like domain-containing protein [Bacteroidia bacterium]|jgi:rhodanese-related sulfurtransferase|nr:rhodanese-like domain-containing protein [Bacteroidia bacterium]